MELFEPKTFSTDWEIMVFDRQERAVGTEKLFGFSGVLRQELGLPIQIDYNTVECALGVNRSFGQLRERIDLVTTRLSDLLARHSLDPCPAGSHPHEQMYNASHVHIGTVKDETLAIHLEADMIPYVAAFAALAANSPFSLGRRDEFKSYRVRFQAHGCTQPSSVRNPHLAQDMWGMDAGPKLGNHATFEVRIVDCASSRRLLAELATFIAAYVHYRSRHITKLPPSPELYERSMVNRWLAARHGLQATFQWEGGPRPVVEIITEMIDDCAAALETLGARRNDLVLINRMLQKRTCQADYLMSLAARYAEPWQLGSAMTKALRHWDAFDNFLETAPTLDPTPAPDRETVLAEHLAVVGEGTHFYHSRRAMRLPPPAADAVVEELIRDGRLALEQNQDGGTLLKRVPIPRD